MNLLLLEINSKEKKENYLFFDFLIVFIYAVR
jgi:hypothetical protein